MAATGYTPILIYASATPGNTPLAANLTSDATNGAELALNYADGKLFYKDSGGTVQVLAGKGGSGVVAGSNTQIQFNNSGAFGASANLTWDGTSLTASNYVSTGNITINTNKFTVTGSSGNTVVGGTLTVNSLTSGRVTFAGASGLLSDSANLTWNGSTLAITGALTASSDSTFSSTGALLISKGTTAQQPGTPVTGMLRYNTTTNQFEGYSGSSPAWNPVGGASLSNDTSTSSNVYPVFANATSGTATTLYTGNANLLYKPSTGEFQARVPVALNGLVLNATTLVSSYTIPTGYSANSVGGSSGFTVPSGMSVTISSGSRWVVL
jgi:hypothetical protein